jgi:hypothetical protein
MKYFRQNFLLISCRCSLLNPLEFQYPLIAAMNNQTKNEIIVYFKTAAVPVSNLTINSTKAR